MSDKYTSEYLSWLKKNMEEFKIDENTYRFTLPYLDRSNDQIEIYIIDKGNGKYRISDDGEVLSSLDLAGLNPVSSDKRNRILNQVLASHGVSRSENELYVEAYTNDLQLRKHMLSQCMVKVSDMFYLASPTTKTLFLEDVRCYLDSNEIRYTEDVSFTGISKYSSNYDFVIPPSRRAPERIIKTVNTFNKSQMKNIIFSWNDTKVNRSKESILYTFIHDVKDNDVSAIDGLKEYGIQPIEWKERDLYLGQLIA